MSRTPCGTAIRRMKDDNEPAKTPSPPKAGSWMPSSGLRPPPTRRILFGGEGFGSCLREVSSNGSMHRDGKSPCPPRRQGNAAVARPTALRPLPLSTGTFSAHTGPDWTTLPGVGGAVSGRPSARGPCPRRLPRRLRPGFLPALQAWRFRERLAKSHERAYPRVAAMHSWKQRTRQRYGSAIHQLAEFEACIPTKALPEVLSLCMAERAADGHSASGLRGLASAVRAAEDLALVPRVVAALHWRIANSGRGPGPQAYVSPRALVHIWNAATAPDDRAVAALAALLWTMWLRVGEAASIR